MNPILPLEIIDNIILRTRRYDLVIPFERYLSKRTIKTLLNNTTVEREIVKNNVELVRMMTSSKYDEFEVNWLVVSVYNISEELIREYANNVNWYYISEHKLSDQLIRDYADRLDWNKLSKYQSLSLDIIREFTDRVEWNYISEYQILDSDFIRQYAHQLNWNILCTYQRITNTLIYEFQHLIFIDK